MYILARYLSSAKVAACTAEVSLFNYPDILTYPDTARFFVPRGVWISKVLLYVPLALGLHSPLELEIKLASSLSLLHLNDLSMLCQLCYGICLSD